MCIRDRFEAVKQSVTTRQAAEHYGIRVNRNGMACCPVSYTHLDVYKRQELKRTHQMEWVQRCNNIHNRAEEIILREIIYS